MTFRRLSASAATMSLEAAKSAAALKAISHVKNGQAIGVGSGSTIVHFVRHLAESKLDVVCVPTSFQSRQLLLRHGLRVGDLETHPRLDVAVDGADEVDRSLNLIKGGGGCMLQEKVVASCARSLVVVADHTKDSTRLGEQWKKGVPLEVVPMAHAPVKLKIERLLGGEAALRMAVAKAGPCVTDNGNFILDWKFDADVERDWGEVDRSLRAIPGVVETGLFVMMAEKAYFGRADGSVTER